MVESEPGKGSIFKIYFPESKDEIIKKEKGFIPESGSCKRILFIDDEEMIILGSKTILERSGFDVHSVQIPETAISLFREHPDYYDIVITDHKMPDMTGIELAEKILAIREDIPIVLCSGFLDRKQEKKAYDSGIKAILLKPYTKSELLKAILSNA